MDLPDARLVILVAALSWPGLALLGAGLAPTAVGSRTDAVAAGIALGIGAPVAAITSTLIGVGFFLLFFDAIDWGVLPHIPLDSAGEALGKTVRLGVLGAIRITPLVAAAATLWILVLRGRRIRRFD
jgi:hypothetical protein